MKKEALLSCGWHDKKTSVVSGLFGTTNSSWSGVCTPVPTAGRFPDWKIAARHLLPRAKAPVAGAKHPDADSLITVTRSCGICTRFPFTLSAVQCIGKRHLLFFCSVRPALYH